MRSFYSIPCLLLILMTISGGFSRMKTTKSAKTSVNRKRGSKIPQVISPKPGQLFYKGSRLTLLFNMTDESQIYAANYTMFPDELYFPRLSKVNSYEEFLGPCKNTTLELEANKDRISKMPSDLHTRVTIRIIEFLCEDNYNRENNDAGLYPLGSWVMTTVTAVVLSMMALN